MLYAEGASHPKMLSVGLHSRVSGHPGRAVAVSRFLEYVRGHDRARFAGRDDLHAGGWSPTRRCERLTEVFGVRPGRAPLWIACVRNDKGCRRQSKAALAHAALQNRLRIVDTPTGFRQHAAKKAASEPVQERNGE
jgi:hypothetical protein